MSRLIGLTFSGDLGLFLDSLDKTLRRPWEAKPEIWAPDGTPIECTTDEHFVPIVRRTKAPLKAAPVVESAAAGFRRHFSHQ